MSIYMHIQVRRTIDAQNLNMDRCIPYNIHEESCKDDLITHVYNGTDMVVYDVNLHAYTGIYYIPITDMTLELPVFWPSDTESRINELRFSESISLSFKTRLTLITCFCGEVM